MCQARKATHLSNLALQFFDCVELPLPAVLSSHFVLPTASDVAAELHLEIRSLSSLRLSPALCSQEKYFVLKKRLCSREKALCSQGKNYVLMKKHFVVRKSHLFWGETRSGQHLTEGVHWAVNHLPSAAELQIDLLFSKRFFFIFKKCGPFVLKKTFFLNLNGRFIFFAIFSSLHRELIVVWSSVMELYLGE